jgi:ArsR family metal-binding transcriptional regulator
MATPAKGTILKFLEAAVANITYTNVNFITVSKVRALTTLSSEGHVTLADISEPKIE